MRWTVVALVLALLLPSLPVDGGRGGSPGARPLDLFGGGEGPLSGGVPALVVEAYYHALRADEYVAIANVDAASLDLDGWGRTDRARGRSLPPRFSGPPG